jgi:hypothetical protein
LGRGFGQFAFQRLPRIGLGVLDGSTLVASLGPMQFHPPFGLEAQRLADQGRIIRIMAEED